MRSLSIEALIASIPLFLIGTIYLISYISDKRKMVKIEEAAVIGYETMYGFRSPDRYYLTLRRENGTIVKGIFDYSEPNINQKVDLYILKNGKIITYEDHKEKLFDMGYFYVFGACFVVAAILVIMKTNGVF